MAGARRKREVRRILAVALGFALIAPVFPASDRHRAGGGNWLDAYLACLPVVVATSAVLVAVMLFGARPQRDGMPAALLASSEPAGNEEEEPWRVPASERRSTIAGFAFVGSITVVSLFKTVEDGPAVTVFMACCLAGFVLAVRWSWRSPRTIVLDADALHVEMQGGGEVVIPLSTVTEICNRFGAHVYLLHDGGQLALSKRIAGLGDLVLEVRRRNPAIAYEGSWPITR